MLKIDKKQDGDKLTIALEGRLDTTTAPQLEEEVNKMGDVKELIFDFTKLEYISSAGLRVLLASQKIMNKQGSMKVTNTNEEVKEIFEVTGFIDVLTVE